MSTALIRPTAVATIGGDDFAVRPGSTARLDSTAVPYASATLELPMLAEAALETLDPRDGSRVAFVHGINGGTPRPFDLAVRRRATDPEAKTVTVELASDELLLQKYKALAPDAGARAHEASCRAVCNYVLAKVGAALEPGADNAAVTAYWPVTNQLPNPSFETNLTGWSTGFGASALTRVANGATPVGAGWVMRWTATAATSAIVAAPGPASFPATPGRSYVFTIYAYGGAARTASARLQWYSSNGTVLIGEVAGASQVLDTTGVFKRFTVTAIAPPGATTVQPILFIHNSANGEAFIVDCAMLYEGTEVVPYFDGATAASATYTYAWSGTAHASPSARTPVVERLPELFLWKPGVSAWDFLMAITASVGLVLWCDELRNWWLTTPEHRTIVSLITVNEGNTRGGSDTIDLDDDETTPTGVVVTYVWTDENGIRREEYDSAGTPERPFSIELTDRAYPGPGTAASILARRQGTGRRQDVDTITQLSVTPGMTAQISLPAAPDTVGRIASVVFDLGAGFMTLSMAGLVDVLPGSIDALVGTIDALVGTIDSL